jgi:dUTP pyrophosphatase
MSKVKIGVKSKNPEFLPVYTTAGAVGADVKAELELPITLTPGSRELIPTGLFFEIPDGYEIQVRPRSGLALKFGVTVLNTPGTIDSDYRGELKVILINLGKENFVVENGMRIAQIVVQPAIQVDFEIENELTLTSRGERGFGSTGV